MSPTLAIATAELHLRLDRLERVTARPIPAPHVSVTTVLDRYNALLRRLRADGGAS